MSSGSQERLEPWTNQTSGRFTNILFRALGGLAIYASFFLSLVLYIFIDPALHPFSSMHLHTGVMLAVSLTLVLILGIWDDLRQLTPGLKFFFQCLAAAIVYFAGFRISFITHPFNQSILDLGIFTFPATILWIVGITNAFNLIDGLDGLASGVAFIVSLTICMISFMKQDMATAMTALLLAGAVLGFLRYNFNGAKIFLGDSGSLFLGFALAILSMQSSTKAGLHSLLWFPCWHSVCRLWIRCFQWCGDFCVQFFQNRKNQNLL